MSAEPAGELSAGPSSVPGGVGWLADVAELDEWIAQLVAARRHAATSQRAARPFGRFGHRDFTDAVDTYIRYLGPVVGTEVALAVMRHGGGTLP